MTSRQQDKQNLQLLERKLQDERKCKAVLEQQLATERKAKKDQEAANRASALAAARSVPMTPDLVVGISLSRNHVIGAARPLR